ncbi:hypothetical protein [Pseudoclavibacter sp. AY1F1]|uniref:rhamnosyltransferase WsaF family glycosyltransferase n=1 Tax=Pseudoclavibacter sp. AY1F1 TaxID=2080583 RepID=UPI0011B0BA87|nr:hypothetical protein [Pseudoclavibacter sp. AY1F1]
MQVSASAPRRVTMLLPELRPSAVFAGIDTALKVSAGLAARLGLPLRLVSIGNEIDAKSLEGLLADIRGRLVQDVELEVVGRESLDGLEINTDDYWVATFWTTAHALSSAAKLGLISRSRVVYLVQDYEPGFVAWSTEFALARATYHADFTLVVNSSPLAAYLEANENLSLSPELVFRPQIDLRETAPAKSSAGLTILFYGRPSKPRNLYGLGVAALQEVASVVDEWQEDVRFISAGEAHTPIELTSKSRLQSVGRLSWDEYFELLSEVDVVLSLQHSPHPSHPPFDALVRGTQAVTNELGGTRGQLSDLLTAAEPRPASLAAGVVAALERVRAGDSIEPDLAVLSRLGAELSDVLDAAVEELQAAQERGGFESL